MARSALALLLSLAVVAPATGCYLGHGRNAHRAAYTLNAASVVAGSTLLVVAPHDPEHDLGPDKTPFHATLVAAGLLGILYNAIDH